MHDVGDVILVDDVVTSGATILGVASKLAERFPDVEIKAFAAMRTISDPLKVREFGATCHGPHYPARRVYDQKALIWQARPPSGCAGSRRASGNAARASGEPCRNAPRRRRRARPRGAPRAFPGDACCPRRAASRTIPPVPGRARTRLARPAASGRVPARGYFLTAPGPPGDQCLDAFARPAASGAFAPSGRIRRALKDAGVLLDVAGLLERLPGYCRFRRPRGHARARLPPRPPARRNALHAAARRSRTCAAPSTH